jgi:hydroxymethylglutaryl-CoA reductase (NADPH)
MLLFHYDSSLELWNREQIISTIDAIHQVHSTFTRSKDQGVFDQIGQFDITRATELYLSFISLNRRDYDYLDRDHYFEEMLDYITDWSLNGFHPKGELTLIHNDFNPRNVGIRKNGNPCIYDWELATFGMPQRDIFEFLSFTLPSGFAPQSLQEILLHHYELLKVINPPEYGFPEYIHDFRLAGKAFLVSRVNFYLSGSTLVNYSFTERIFNVSFEILKTVKAEAVVNG